MKYSRDVTKILKGPFILTHPIALQNVEKTKKYLIDVNQQYHYLFITEQV